MTFRGKPPIMYHNLMHTPKGGVFTVMRWRKMAVLFLVTALLLVGCAEESAVVPVVQMRPLTRAGEAGERFACVLVSQNALQIRRDPTQTIAVLCVA